MSKLNLALGAALALPLVLIGLIGGTGAVAMPHMSDVSCLARDTLNDYLDRAYGEGRIAHAELENGHKVELFLSRRGTWTLVELMPDGKGCVHAYGQRMKVDTSLPAGHNPS
ncbi:MAG: hypothetical protein HN478_02800 [Rhodospirillaceae bacterium]|jgi:hypothetical protein|nr:hypothetical protein [Rhodospirillaceae bacterium]MBT4488471.1 hypothetical protein [Rhodospirillaceae bacterium]MBT5895919.1 hypothetical protein [Rhodospirillaceae bacterium]MBT6426068.1 hypothetical protein [Rhodospirillaceae bacterium]MBT7759766.1 hypothetical protein [Rhodospirillaceae bacterium]